MSGRSEDSDKLNVSPSEKLINTLPVPTTRNSFAGIISSEFVAISLFYRVDRYIVWPHVARARHVVDLHGYQVLLITLLVIGGNEARPQYLQ